MEQKYLGKYSLSRRVEMSPEDKRKSVHGDKNQGSRLINKKFSTPKYRLAASNSQNGLDNNYYNQNS